MQPITSVGPNADFGAVLALRRGVLLAARDLSAIQDKIDCAELALALGLDRGARALGDLAFVRAGFAPSRRGWQDGIAGRTGLWDGDLPLLPDAAAPRGFSVDVAIAELARLIAPADPPPFAPYWPDVVEALVEKIAPADAPPAAGGSRPPSPKAVFEACGRLHLLLRRAPGGAVAADLAGLLDRLGRDVLDVPPFDPRADVADPETLIAAFCAADLRDFLSANRTLAYPPFGSAELLHAAARLEPAGLGPYLGNVARIIRDSRDVPALVQLAAGDAADAATLDRWMPLMTTHVGMGTLLDLIDELGDRGLMRPLWPLLYVVVRDLPRHRDRAPLWRVRDAALDNRDGQLGACAQRAIARWAADDAVEWSILGEIHATAGDLREARRAFLQGLRAARRSDHLRSRLRLLRAGELGPLVIDGGFGTPKGRQRRRLARHPEPALGDGRAPPA